MSETHRQSPTEPITFTAPKITYGDDFHRLRVPEREKVAFLCPAQSSPLAAFR